MVTRTRTKKAAPARSDGAAARLKTYHDKRDFQRTPEPSGATRKKTRTPAPGSQFVVQKHAASHLHYDFRLELNGVLLSWSVPKGPSLKAGLRRLGVRTEDHPLDYANFEGVIPKGEYGGGTVIVWDRGSWIPEGDADKGLKSGRLTFDLHGEKLKGRFHLVRTRLDEGKHENWLLFKGRDDQASDTIDIVRDRPESAISGRTIEEVAQLPNRVWHSNREADARATEKEPSKKKSNSETDTVALVKRLPWPFALTNLDKVLYPDEQLRKADIIAYYVTVASFMLPHVKDRPLTLLRCPNGAEAKCFYQKHVSDSVPAVVLRVSIDENSKDEIYMAVQDLPGLVALAQMGVLEIHTWGCHREQLEKPDKLVFDIDPAEGVAWDHIIEAALELRMRLQDLSLRSFVQTTGGKGLHVVAPLAPQLSWEQHKNFSHAIAESMATEKPARYLTNMKKSLRKGKIFLDYLRNGRGATAVAPYSTRARSGATVAAPISWDELTAGAKPADFTVQTMVDRITTLEDDPWKDYGRIKQSVTARTLKALK